MGPSKVSGQWLSRIAHIPADSADRCGLRRGVSDGARHARHRPRCARGAGDRLVRAQRRAGCHDRGRRDPRVPAGRAGMATTGARGAGRRRGGMLLAAKRPLHRFATKVVSDQDVKDAMSLFVVAFVVLPLLPNRPLGPYGVLNPARVWWLVVAVTLIGWTGYVAARALCQRRARTAEAAVAMPAFLLVLFAGGWWFGSLPDAALLATASGSAFTAVVLGQLANAYACRSATRPVTSVGCEATGCSATPSGSSWCSRCSCSRLRCPICWAATRLHRWAGCSRWPPSPSCWWWTRRRSCWGAG